MSKASVSSNRSVVCFVFLLLAGAVAMLMSGAGSAYGKVLVNQSGGTVMPAVLSQELPDPYTGSSSFAADDFVVPNNKVWQLTSIRAYGAYNTVASNNVLRANVGVFRTTPGNQPTVASYRGKANVKPNGSTASGVVNLKLAMVAAPGRNWIAVQSILSLQPASRAWLWETTSGTSGLPAHLRNPGGLFYAGCTAWQATTVCVPTSGTKLRYRMVGIVGDARFRELKAKFTRKNGGLQYVVTVNLNNIGKFKVSSAGFKPVKKKIKKIGKYTFSLNATAGTLAKYRSGQRITARAKYRLPALLPSGFTAAPAPDAAADAVLNGTSKSVAG